MYVDVIMLTKSDSYDNINKTKHTAITLHDSESDFNFKICLIETLPNQPNHYEGLVHRYFCPEEPFNYNRYLNKGFDKVTSDWVVISNNDVRYERGWFSEIMKIHSLNPSIQSFSPKDPAYYALYYDGHFLGSKHEYFESYKVSEAVMGWCIVIKNDALNMIRPFDEQFDMYYQDNDYAEMLKANGIKHALVRNSLALHLGTFETTKISKEKMQKMQDGEEKFYNKWIKNK